jgi:hypothetical protein
MMAIMGDRVPMFKLRPYKSLLIAAGLIGVIGYLLSAYFFIEDSYLSHNRGIDTAILTSIIVLLLVLGAYSRYGFRHLHHRRPGYKRG